MALLNNNKNETVMSVVRKCYMESFRCENLISANRMTDDKTSVCLQSEDVLEFLASKKHLSLLENYVICTEYASFRTNEGNLFHLSVLYNQQKTVMEIRYISISNR